MEVKVGQIQTQVDGLHERIKDNEKRLDCAEKEIDELYKSINTLDKDLALLKQTNGHILENTKDIKKAIENSDIKWDELKKQRDKDHLEYPVSKIDKYKDQIIMGVIMAFVMFILFLMFPFLKI